jgi:hypothetical protein
MNTKINFKFVENYKVENRKKIEKYLSNKYPNSQLKNEELKYDFNQVNADFIKEISKKIELIDYNLIDKLPKINLEINGNEIVNDDDIENEEEEKNTKKINKKISKTVIDKLSKLSIKNEIVEEIDEIEIDKSELEKEKVGDKYYYFDYNKGFIYDLKYNIVGNVDTDTGEIHIE